MANILDSMVSNALCSFSFTPVNLTGDNFFDVDLIQNSIRSESVYGDTDWYKNTLKYPQSWFFGITVITPGTAGTGTVQLLTSTDDLTYIELQNTDNEGLVFYETKDLTDADNPKRVYQTGNNILFDITENNNFIRLYGNDLSGFQRLNLALDSVDALVLNVVFHAFDERLQGYDIINK